MNFYLFYGFALISTDVIPQSCNCTWRSKVYVYFINLSPKMIFEKILFTQQSEATFLHKYFFWFTSFTSIFHLNKCYLTTVIQICITGTDVQVVTRIASVCCEAVRDDVLLLGPDGPNIRVVYDVQLQTRVYRANFALIGDILDKYIFCTRIDLE